MAYLKHLLDDKSFFIRMLAVTSLTKIPSQTVIETLVKKMSQEAPQARFPYRQALLKMPLEMLQFLIKIYQSSENEGVRLVCLDVMSRCFISNLLPVIKKDYHSENTEIRLYLVQILGNIASEEATSEILHFLEDPDPRVRAQSLKSLSKIRSEKTFANVKSMLHDPDYNVRLQAALALVNFGKEGIRALELQDWDLNPEAYEVARFVLTMP